MDQIDFISDFFLQHHRTLQRSSFRQEWENIAGKIFRAVFDLPMQFNASKAKWGAAEAKHHFALLQYARIPVGNDVKKRLCNDDVSMYAHELGSPF